MKKKPVVLVIRDGWGENPHADQASFNAVKRASTPFSDKLSQDWPRTEIAASGLAVGLPEGVMGNSEVGHQNIGAGRIVDQELVRINKTIVQGKLGQNEVLTAACARLSKSGKKMHLMGIASDAGVHGKLDHLYALLKTIKEKEIKEVFIHAFMDGRDTPPFSGLSYIREIEKECQRLGIGRIASVCGRYWSMDRDNRWARVEKAYQCLAKGLTEAPKAKTAEEAVQYYYDHPVEESRRGDEFILPTSIVDHQGRPLALIEDGDSVIFYNFRGDRPREITRAFIDESFEGFPRERKQDLFFATLSEYEKGLCPNVLFSKPPKMKDVLGQYISDLGLLQFRCAETEKYPHVTFFFNDYREEPFPGEDHKLINSPCDVSTYDQKPEMSAYGVCETTCEAILSGKYDLVIVNFANPDMVGHTGSLEATVKACETVDNCLKKLMDTIESMDGTAIITADHGNAEQMFNPNSKSAHTSHTLNLVELIIFGRKWKNVSLRSIGCLADIAPTLLHLMDLEQPSSMTGKSLVV